MHWVNELTRGWIPVNQKGDFTMPSPIFKLRMDPPSTGSASAALARHKMPFFVGDVQSRSNAVLLIGYLSKGRKKRRKRLFYY
jgi:hypothetical protein